MTDDQIIALFGQVPHFIDEKILPLERELLESSREYTTFIYTAYEASINLMEVKGTQHPDYIGLSWRELLSKGRRENLEAFQNNPAYYTEIQKRDPNMHYLKINGDIYVTEDGNHRTCIGKCFLYGRDNPYIHSVHLVEKQVDGLFAAQVNFLKESAPPDWRVKVIQEHIGRDDGPGWYRDFYRLWVEVESAGRMLFRADAKELARLTKNELAGRLAS